MAQQNGTVTAPPILAPRQNGNALISFDLNSGTYNIEIWIAAFRTGAYTQFESDQVHTGIAWFPIRRSEMFIEFTILWPHYSQNLVTADNPSGNGLKVMQNFQDLLRQHQQESALTAGQPLPITLIYYNNQDGSNPIISNNLPNLGNNTTLKNEAEALGYTSSGSPLKQMVYQGWMQSVEKEYSRFKSYYTRTYNMNVLNQQVGAGISVTSSTLTNAPMALTNAYMIPTSNSAMSFGSSTWTSSPGAAQGNAIDLNQIVG